MYIYIGPVARQLYHYQAIVWVLALLKLLPGAPRRLLSCMSKSDVKLLPNTVPKDLAGVGENSIEHEFSGAQRVDVSSFFSAYTVRALTSYIFV